MSADEVRDALHRARAAIDDAARLTVAVPVEVADEDVKAAELAYALHPDATDGCTITGPMRAALAAFAARLAGAQPQPAETRCADCRHSRHPKGGCEYVVRHVEPDRDDVLCYCATASVPTQADALRAAARLVEMVGGRMRLNFRSTLRSGLEVDPSYGHSSLDDLANLRQLAEMFGATVRDGYASDGYASDGYHVLLTFVVEVDGVPITAAMHVSGDEVPETAAEARAWIAEAAGQPSDPSRAHDIELTP